MAALPWIKKSRNRHGWIQTIAWAISGTGRAERLLTVIGNISTPTKTLRG